MFSMVQLSLKPFIEITVQISLLYISISSIKFSFGKVLMYSISSGVSCFKPLKN